MTNYNLFPGAAPAVQAYDRGSGVNLGTSFKVSAPAWLTHLRYLSGNGADYDASARTGVLWKIHNVSGDSLGIVVAPFTIPAPSGPDVWTEAALPEPFALEVGQLYRIAIHHPNGGYPASTHYFDNPDGLTDFVYGPVTVPAVGNVPWNAQGTFKYTANYTDIPDSTFNAAAYYSDATITDVDPTAVDNIFAADGSAYRAFALLGGILTQVTPNL